MSNTTRDVLLDALLFLSGWGLGWLLTDDIALGLMFAFIFSGTQAGVRAVERD